MKKQNHTHDDIVHSYTSELEIRTQKGNQNMLSSHNEIHKLRL